MSNSVQTVQAAASAHLAMRRTGAVVAGALLVAAGAQLAIPVPGTLVPITLQVPAVLIVGGVLGPAYGAVSLALYLVMGAAGLPVFAPGGVPGVARLFGPTGGYLLAMPLATAVIGRIASEARGWLALAIGLLAATAVIHAGGVAQLALLGGDLGVAARAGSLPFLAGDAVKLLFAGLVIHKFGPTTRRALH